MIDVRKTTSFLSLLLITCYLFWGRFSIFSEFEDDLYVAENPVYSKVLDLSKPGIIDIEVDNLYNKFQKNQIQLLLTCQKTSQMKDSEYWDKNYSLKLKLRAHAIIDNEIEIDRLVRNSFHFTDEPMAQNSKLWAGWPDDRMEYYLGSMVVYPKEQQLIQLDVVKPDYVLNSAEPRLKIVAKYDPAITGHLPLLKLFRDVLLAICLCGLAFLFYNCITSKQT